MPTPEKPKGYMFSSRTSKFTPGYSITSQFFYPYYLRTDPYTGEQYEGWDDGLHNEPGRVIYNTPTSSDTVYYNYPDNFAAYDTGYMPIGTTKDQETAKKRFYKYANWAKPEKDEESKNALHRAKVNKNQQGGVMNQQIQQQVIQLIQAAAQGDQNANKQIEQIMQAAQQGDQQAIQIAQMIQQVVEQMKQQSGIKAQLGAKLNYIRKIKGLCPEGQELVYMKEGGRMCARCMQKAQNGTKTTKKPDTVQGSKKKKTPMPTKYDGKKHERLALLNADPKKKLTQAQTDSLNTYAKLYRELPDSIKARDYNDQDVLSKACGGKAKKH